MRAAKRSPRVKAAPHSAPAKRSGRSFVLYPKRCGGERSSYKIASATDARTGSALSRARDAPS
eukprot:scaffold143970_cov130-Phaeocystis_antarctica.AAC.2